MPSSYSPGMGKPSLWVPQSNGSSNTCVCGIWDTGLTWMKKPAFHLGRDVSDSYPSKCGDKRQ